MSEETERITILLQAKDAEFQRALDKNNRALAKFAKQADRDTKGISKNLNGLGGQADAFGKNFVSGLAVGAITAALGAISGNIRQVIADVADMGDAAARAGIDVEQFQALRFGFEQAGVSVADTTAAMEIFAERVGDAARGSGVLGEVLAANGIELRDVEGNMRATNDLLQDFADLIQRTPDAAQQMSLVTDAFGKGGKAMVLALAEGSAGLEEMKTQAQEAGAMLTTEMVEKAQALDDRFAELTARVSTLFATWKIEAGSAAVAVADLLAQPIIGTEEVREAAYAHDALVEAAERAADAVGNEAAAFAEADYPQLAEEIANISARMDQLAIDFGKGEISAEEFAVAIGVDVAEAEKLLTQLQAVNGISMSGAISVLQALGSQLVVLQGQAAATARAVAAAAMTLPPLRGPAGSSGVAPLRSGMAPTTSPRPRSAPNDPDFGFAGGGGGGGGGGGSRAVKDLDVIIQKAEEYAKAMDDYLIDTNEDLRQSFLDLAIDGVNSFDDIAKSIKRAALEAFIFGKGPLGGLLGGGISSLFSGGNLFGGNSWGGARANGGPVTSGSTYMVGEKGPELFTPSVSGAIVPNHKMGGGRLSLEATSATLTMSDDGTIKGTMVVTARQAGEQAVATARRSQAAWQAEHLRTGGLV
jgi:hypothetical protein